MSREESVSAEGLGTLMNGIRDSQKELGASLGVRGNSRGESDLQLVHEL